MSIWLGLNALKTPPELFSFHITSQLLPNTSSFDQILLVSLLQSFIFRMPNLIKLFIPKVKIPTIPIDIA